MGIYPPPPPGARNPDPGLLINLSRGLYENCYYAITFFKNKYGCKEDFV